MGPDFGRVLGEHVGGFDPEVLVYRCLCLETFAEPEDYRAHVAAELSAELASWLVSDAVIEPVYWGVLALREPERDDLREALASLVADSGGAS